MQFATLFYRLRLSEEKDDDILAPDMLNMPNGVFPQVITLASAQDEIARVANEVSEFLRQGYPAQPFVTTARQRAGGTGADPGDQSSDWGKTLPWIQKILILAIMCG